MTFPRHARLSSYLVIGLVAVSAAPAEASLGGGIDSVAADATMLRGVAVVTPLPDYDIQEIAAADGSHVREFLDRTGMVFAVSWAGPVLPDLHALLGDAFPAYRKALAAVDHRGQRRSLRVTTADLIVETSGHMRAYAGRAYLPSRLPHGTPASSLR